MTDAERRLRQNLRSVLRPRSSVNVIVERLVAASERAEGITLSLRDASVLLTFIEAAQGIATVATERADARAAQAEIGSMKYQLRKTTEAWHAAERRLHQYDLIQSRQRMR